MIDKFFYVIFLQSVLKWQTQYFNVVKRDSMIILILWRVFFFLYNFIRAKSYFVGARRRPTLYIIKW